MNTRLLPGDADRAGSRGPRCPSRLATGRVGWMLGLPGTHRPLDCNTCGRTTLEASWVSRCRHCRLSDTFFAPRPHAPGNPQP